MIHSIFPSINPSGKNHSDLSELQTLRQQYLQNILYASVIVGTLMFAMVSFNSIQKGLWGLFSIHLITFGWILFITFFRKLSYLARSVSVLLILYIQGLVSMIGCEQPGTGMIYLLTITIITSILLGIRRGWVVLGISAATLAFIGIGFYNHIFPISSFNWSSNNNQLSSWGIYIGSFLMLSLVVITAIHNITTGLIASLESKNQLNDDLQLVRSSLETRVEERTNQLRKQTAQLAAASEIAHEISSETDLSTLLNNSLYLIQKQFGFYHASIFLLDSRKEYAVLRASTGEAGRQMLEHHHQLKVGSQGIVGFAVSQGISRIASDVGRDAIHFQNPLLPYTRSEAALPLRVGENIIGALDVQSMVPDAFSEDDMNILQTISDQLAMVIEKNHLLEELKSINSRLKTITQEGTRYDWQNHLRKVKRNYAYRYRHSALEPVVEKSPIVEQALLTGKPVVHSGIGEDAGVSFVAVPITLRGQTLGVVDLRCNTPNVPGEVLELIQATTERMAITMDNVRLLEQLRMRANLERLVGDISSQLQTSTEIESILQTTAMELGKALGSSEVLVQLHAPEGDHSDNPEVS